MKKRMFLVFIAMLFGVLSFPKISSAEETAPLTGVPSPAPAACSQGNGLWRIYDHLVITMEWCTSFDIDPPDTLVQLLESTGDPSSRCYHSGGRYEFIGNKNSFNLHVCWNMDYIIVPEPTASPVWDGIHPRICLDFDGATITEYQTLEPVTYTVPPSTLSSNNIAKILTHLRTKYAAWPITFDVGECRDEKSATLYVTANRVPAQDILAAGTDGYAWIGGLSSQRYNFGFVFMTNLSALSAAAVATHEAGHLFGLQHPYGLERAIMSDGHDASLDFSDSDKVLLSRWFSDRGLV